MNKTEFSDALLRRGCVGSDKVFCGVYNEYPFAVTFFNGSAGGKTTFMFYVQFAGKVPAKMIRLLRKELPRPTQVKPAQNYDPTHLALMVTTRDAAGLEIAVDRLLAAVARMAPEFGLRLPDLCPVCKQTGCDAFSFQHMAYRPVHGHCVQHTAAAKVIAAETNIRHGSYFSGSIGAILGGVVGALPTVFILTFTDYIIAWLCALIPLGAYYGYKLFGGRMTKAVLAVVLPVSVLMVPVTLYAYLALTMWVYEDQFFLDPALFISVMTTSTELIPLLLQILLFVAIGTAIVSGIISRTGHSEIKDSSFALATLRPMAHAIPAAQQASVEMAGETGHAAAPAPMASQLSKEFVEDI